MTAFQDALNHLSNKQYTWLVTGAAGFIGSNLVEKLISLNQRVVGLDNFETGYQYNLDQALEDANQAACIDCSSLLNFQEGDIRVLEDCKKAMIWHLDGATHPVDFVLHQAALGSVPRSIKDPIQTNKANIDGFLNMLVAARDAKVKSFVYAASSSTYGDHPDLPKVEDKIGSLLSPYAVTKYVNELYAEVFAKIYNLKSVGLRYFNVFGKRQDPNGAYAAVIPRWIEAVIKKHYIQINGDGKTSRDFCYIENAIQANILAALSENKDSYSVFNVSAGENITLIDLYNLVVENANLHGIQYDFPPNHVDFRPGDVRHSLADLSKISSIIGYLPNYDVRSGLEHAFFWYKNNVK